MKYIFYFFYIGWHWDFELAFFIIRREIKGERKYGINTTGKDSLRSSLSWEDRLHATMYEPVNYYTAEWLFDHITPEEKQTGFVDLGCGKGRVLAIAAAYGFRRIEGVELSARLCRLIPEGRYTLHCMDARDYVIPDHIGVIFLFNPFDDIIMQKVISNVMDSITRCNRPVRVLYANPRHKALWLEAGFTETDNFTRMTHLQGAVLDYRPLFQPH